MSAHLIDSRIDRLGGGIFRVQGRFADDTVPVVVDHSADYDKNGADTPSQFKTAYAAAVQAKMDAAVLAYNDTDETADRNLEDTVHSHLQDIASELT